MHFIWRMQASSKPKCEGFCWWSVTIYLTDILDRVWDHPRHRPNFFDSLHFLKCSGWRNWGKGQCSNRYVTTAATCTAMPSTAISWVSRAMWHTAFEMWWHTRRNQISSFGETDESIEIGGGVSSVDCWQPRCAHQR